MRNSTLQIPYDAFRVKEAQGRYLPPELLGELLAQYTPPGTLSVIGHSAQRRPIFQVRLGSGPIKILMWSQMHGNESTTTKALLDLLSYLQKAPRANSLLSAIELCLIPMLNPDGALAYTRVNANGVDLNRDAACRNEPESRVLRQVFEGFAPHFCFNLHDQRSIYGVGDSGVSATLSFLAPSADPERTITPARRQAMKLIAGLASALSTQLPGGIGRYDDSFNANCVGDQFQMAGVPTLLFEAGHYPNDYERETTRRLVFLALWEALQLIIADSFSTNPVEAYQAIPENRKNFVDILIKNPGMLNERYKELPVLALHFEERLHDGELLFMPALPEAGLTESCFGHVVYNASRAEDRGKILAQPALSKLFS